MTLTSQIYPGSIGLFLIFLQNFKTCSGLNTIELQEIDYLASNLSPEECFQLYNLLDHRHVNRDETSKYLHKKNQAIPCFNLLAIWSTDPDESDHKAVDRINSKLEKIGRKDLALWLDRSLIRRKDDGKNGKKVIYEATLRDERLQRSTCPTRASGRKKIFWKVFFVALIILILFLLCICCCCCIYAILRCIRNKFDRSGNKEEKERCLCDDENRTTVDDCCANKKISSFQRLKSKFKDYFKNRQEKRKEKIRFQKFQKLKSKLQKMYFDQQKEVRVNRQEERILHSLTDEERDELGEMIREMKFLLESDEETERLLLSGKRQGTFIIDMKNLRQPKMTRSHESNQEIKTIKKWGSKDRLSSSLSDEMNICVAEANKNSGNESKRSNREKKNLKPNQIRKKPSRHHFEKESPDSTARENSVSQTGELDVKSEFVKCYAISDSDKYCSSPFTWEENHRCSLQSERESNFSTSEETNFLTFQSKNSQNSSPTLSENKRGTQSDVENRRINSIQILKSGSAIELRSQKEIIDKKKSNRNKKGHINSSRTSLRSNSTWNCTPRSSEKISEKPREFLSSFKNSDHGDTESQLDLCETYDELGLLISQHMKQQSNPCCRKYCLLKRHLRQRIHDLKQCQVKKNYFKYYPNDQPPSCSSGNICRDTYDEFNLMRATSEERQKIRQSIYERRKEFLDQPCVSPGRQIFQIFSG